MVIRVDPWQKRICGERAWLSPIGDARASPAADGGHAVFAPAVAAMTLLALAAGGERIGLLPADRSLCAAIASYRAASASPRALRVDLEIGRRVRSEKRLDGGPLTGYAAARFRFGFGFTSVFLSPSFDGVLGFPRFVVA